MSRDHILHKVRTALGRSAGQPAAEPPPVRLCGPQSDLEARIERFLNAVAGLNGKTYRARSCEEVRDYAARLVDGRPAVASCTPVLTACGIHGLPGVRYQFSTRDEFQTACAQAAVGITGADYALADTGTVVLLASHQEPRMISLLPPVHLAVVPKERILSGLDELFTLLPRPSELTSSLVLVTGPSRTADIEQILVRGVHGPGEIHVVVL
ncbi:MAG: lactate utilization protein [Bryobacterales bacterium]|nr:lactate utilization protein [Bryobacteraceae bacterium]MDW8354936.1 lactate utilization protein [Bryobacterales bacterium]